MPVGGTHITAGWAGLLRPKIRAMSEKFTEDCLSWEEPHGIAEEIPFPKQTNQKKLKTDQNSHAMCPCAVGGKEGGAGVEKWCSKGVF